MCSRISRADSARIRSTSSRPSRVRSSRPMNMLRQIGCFSAERPLLIDRLDAEAPRLRDGPVVHALAVEVNLAAGIGRVESHHDLDERRLARAVVAEQADDLPPVDLEIDARERPHLSERLGDVPEFDDRRFAGAGRRWLRHPASR